MQEQVLGVNSWSWRNNDPKSWNASPVDVAHSSEGEGGSHLLPDKERRPIFQETLGPCSLSSSIYYGGQDIYPNSPSTGSSDSSYNFKKDGGDGEDDSNEASRGNWWQGSLYY
ncbi:hypothetical protein GIB67_032646 [Kingdonia uniflora]|uniref:Uncharacterized protein n=1 Tax=Kingdonia uniflora TaxID=39325 RepID=A0A7J7P9K0_9MAGN|nr:hypothetical protein GIB67_032646 [Kingdonia uniflora]